MEACIRKIQPEEASKVPGFVLTGVIRVAQLPHEIHHAP